MSNQKTKRDRFEREGLVVDHPALLLDLGCHVAPSCLACPLARCQYEVGDSDKIPTKLGAMSMWIPTRFEIQQEIPDPAPRHYLAGVTVDFDQRRWNVDVEIYSDTGSGGITTASLHWSMGCALAEGERLLRIAGGDMQLLIDETDDHAERQCALCQPLDDYDLER